MLQFSKWKICLHHLLIKHELRRMVIVEKTTAFLNETNQLGGRFRYWLLTRPLSNESSDQLKRVDHRFHCFLYSTFLGMSQSKMILIKDLAKIRG